MKKTIATALVAVGLGLGMGMAGPASAGVIGFNGPFAPGTWSTTILGNLTGATGGSATMTSTSLSLTGGNGLSPDPANQAAACSGAQYGLRGNCEIDVTTTHIENPFSFSWAYATADSGGPGGDIFGIIVNGVRINLSDPGGQSTQGGTVHIGANSSFGWFVNCTDCIEGAATVRITNFAAPEPASLALLGLGLAGLLVTRRRVR